MGGTIKACECPISIDQSNNESNAIRFPTSIIHKVGEDKSGFLVRTRFGRNCGKDNKKRDQAGIQRDGCDCWENTSIAVEEEGKAIDSLIANKNVPGQNYTIEISLIR